MHHLLTRVRVKLDQALSETWPGRPKVVVELDEATGFDATIGGLVGGISYFVMSESKGKVKIHHEKMGVLRSEDDVDDWLARGLATFLMKHPSWPK